MGTDLSIPTEDGTDRQRGIPLRPLVGFRSILALALLAGWSGLAAGDISYRGGIGIGYQAPREGKLNDLYGAGASFHLMGEAEFVRVPMSLALEVGFMQATCDHLPGSFFVTEAEGMLRRIPIDLLARFPFTDSEAHPYVGVGFEMLWARESFTYELSGERRKRDGSGRFDPGGLLVLGYERSASPRLRLEGYLSYVPASRRVLRAESYEPPAADRIDEGSMGVRIYWRLP
jgi:hypothetical protein